VSSNDLGVLLNSVEEFYAQGHPNVLGTHSMTFEITRDTHLSKRGDCVIAVNATKAPADLSIEFQNLCKQEKSRITITLEAAGIVDMIQGVGNPRLTFYDRSEMVGRKSSFISDRTIMVGANKAAAGLKRSLVEVLKSPTTKLVIRLVAEI
jgi:hypothetical protein